ncbi:hypothetical protein C8J56DRAFT_1068499 [Mycena floridula]|nr:hypothetical protein C8J56DRAFT_1068499 [Mycena floridula]
MIPRLQLCQQQQRQQQHKDDKERDRHYRSSRHYGDNKDDRRRKRTKSDFRDWNEPPKKKECIGSLYDPPRKKHEFQDKIDGHAEKRLRYESKLDDMEVDEMEEQMWHGFPNQASNSNNPAMQWQGAINQFRPQNAMDELLNQRRQLLQQQHFQFHDQNQNQNQNQPGFLPNPAFANQNQQNNQNRMLNAFQNQLQQWLPLQLFLQLREWLQQWLQQQQPQQQPQQRRWQRLEQWLLQLQEQWLLEWQEQWQEQRLKQLQEQICGLPNQASNSNNPADDDQETAPHMNSNGSAIITNIQDTVLGVFPSNAIQATYHYISVDNIGGNLFCGNKCYNVQIDGKGFFVASAAVVLQVFDTSGDPNQSLSSNPT